MQRRSSVRTSRRAYTTDAFATVPELRDVPDSPIAAGEDEKAEQDSDVAFDSDAQDEGDDETDDEPSDGGEDDIGEGIELGGDDGLDDNASAAAGRRAIRSTVPRRKRRRQSEPDRGQDDHALYNRRLNDQLRSRGKEEKHRMLFGSQSTSQGDVPSFDKLKKWRGLPVLPVEGEPPADFAEPEVLHDLHHTEWLWYFEHGGSHAFEQDQICSIISHSEAQDFLPTARQPRDFLVGPVNSPALTTLSSYESISLAAAWSPTVSAFPSMNEYVRRGCYINAGARVRHMDWIPHQPGAEQYLAMSVLPARNSEHTPFEAPEAPAFSSTPAYKTALQIWQVPTSTQGQSTSKAWLRSLLCTSWGDIKAFRFCPMQCALQDKDTPLLLAGIWSDGVLRIIDVPTLLLDTTDKSLIIEKAAVEISPFDTVFTCLTWISPRLVAAACANGSVAIIDIHESLHNITTRGKPSKYAAISDTYIHSIVSCWPSYPAHVFTISMDGFLRLTDTRHSSMSSPAALAQSTRSRAVLPGIIWSECSQSVVITDDNFGIRAAPIRRMFSQFSVGRTKSTAISIANSPCHPFVLLGTTAGETVSFNPMLRLFDHKRTLFTQTWFSHEWRRPMNDDQERHGEAGQRIKEHGLSRFTEGFKAEHIQFKDGDGTTRRYVPQTVYEKETAVTAVAWNPNMHAGGWAAAGLADGLVRVEYLALPR